MPFLSGENKKQEPELRTPGGDEDPPLESARSGPRSPKTQSQMELNKLKTELELHKSRAEEAEKKMYESNVAVSLKQP